MRNNKGGCFITVGTIAISMTILGMFLLVFVNLKNFEEGLGENTTIVVYLEDDLSRREQQNIGSLIEDNVEVGKVHFISKENALEAFKKELGDNMIILEGLETNPLPASFKITVNAAYTETDRLDEKVESLKKIKGVESVDYGKEWIEKFKVIVSFFKAIVISSGGLLCLGLMFIISNTIKLSLYSNSKKIKIMKLVGATDFYIKKIYLIEGMIEGFTGSVISIGLLFLIYKFLLFHIPFYTLLLNSITFIPYSTSAAIITSGVIIGCLGSFISLRSL